VIVTFTGNTSLDHILFVPELGTRGTVRASSAFESMGGKGTDASWILGKLGVPSLALGFIAGSNGERIKEMLQGRGVETDFVTVGGESRRNVVIIDESGSGQVTYTAPSLQVETKHIEKLFARYKVALRRASCVVLAGTLPSNVPANIYTELVGLARAQSIPVVFDASEPFLSAGLAASPNYVKPNLPELEALVGQHLPNVDAVNTVGRKLQRRYGTSFVISLGDQGGLAILPDLTYRIPPITVEVVNSSGAGDGILAGLAYSLSAGTSIEDGLRLGFGIATAVLLSPCTADFDPTASDRFREEVDLTPLKP
jgi:tagatose 6-phosphate kinase